MCILTKERVHHKTRSQPKPSDKAVQGGVPVEGGPDVGKVEEALLLLAGQGIGKIVLVLPDRLHRALHAFVVLKAAVLRVDIAVIELLNKAFHIVSP